MVLYVVGLGLGDEDDITVRGLRAVQRCELVFLEAYTSVLGVSKERLEAAYGKTITVSDRTDVESGAEKIYLPAKDKEVAFLVVGDPLCATTHTDLVLRAKQVGGGQRLP
jgi:diphthine synthase